VLLYDFLHSQGATSAGDPASKRSSDTAGEASIPRARWLYCRRETYYPELVMNTRILGAVRSVNYLTVSAGRNFGVKAVVVR
jgi:hypothetical protein